MVGTKRLGMTSNGTLSVHENQTGKRKYASHPKYVYTPTSEKQNKKTSAKQRDRNDIQNILRAKENNNNNSTRKKIYENKGMVYEMRIFLLEFR